MKSLGLRCDDAFYEQVKEYAYQKRVSVAKLLRVALVKEMEAVKNV